MIDAPPRREVAPGTAIDIGLPFDPYSAAFHNDPYPVYRRLRDHAPVYYHEDLKFFALSRYADVIEAHRDDVSFCSSMGVQIEFADPNEGSALIHMDNPQHR